MTTSRDDFTEYKEDFGTISDAIIGPTPEADRRRREMEHAVIHTVLGALSDPNRPLGATILATWVGFIGAIFFLLLITSVGWLNLYSLAAGFANSAIQQSASSGNSSFSNVQAPLPDTGLVLLWLLIVTAIMGAFLSYSRGLFLLQHWSYWATLITNGLIIFACIIILGFTHNGPWFVTAIYLSVLTSLYMLALPGVRRAFGVPF